jgi:hypothetical protein
MPLVSMRSPNSKNTHSSMGNLTGTVCMTGTLHFYLSRETLRRVPTLHNRATAFLESWRDGCQNRLYVLRPVTSKLRDQFNQSSKGAVLAGLDRSFLKAYIKLIGPAWIIQVSSIRCNRIFQKEISGDQLPNEIMSVFSFRCFSCREIWLYVPNWRSLNNRVTPRSEGRK